MPATVPVPLTHSWFRGVANVRGNLYSVVDFSAFQGGEPIGAGHGAARDPGLRPAAWAARGCWSRACWGCAIPSSSRRGAARGRAAVGGRRVHGCRRHTLAGARPARARARAAVPRSGRVGDKAANGESTSGETQILVRRTGSSGYGARRPKPAARPARRVRLDDDQPARGRPRAARAPSAAAKAARRSPGGRSLAGFRLPVHRRASPVIAQMQVLGTIALRAARGDWRPGLPGHDARARATRPTSRSPRRCSSTRSASRRPRASRRAASRPRSRSCRTAATQFADYLKILQRRRLRLRRGRAQRGDQRGAQEPPRGARASAGRRARTRPRRSSPRRRTSCALAQNIAQMRVGAEEMATLSQELTGLMTQSGSPPAQVLRANRLTFLAERLGRGVGGDPGLGGDRSRGAVPHRQGHQRHCASIIRALETGSDALGHQPRCATPRRAPSSRELKKQFATFEQNVGPDPARAAEARDRAPGGRAAGRRRASSCRAAVATLQEAIQAEKPVARDPARSSCSRVLLVAGAGR